MTPGRGRRGRRWQDIGEDDHFAGDAYFARWLDETDDDDDQGSNEPGAVASRDDEVRWPRRRDVLSAGMDTPLWWRIWRWWR